MVDNSRDPRWSISEGGCEAPYLGSAFAKMQMVMGYAR